MPPDVLVVDAGLNGIYLSFFGFFFIALDSALILLIKSRIENGFYDTLMMRGATKFSYWSAHYVKDFCLYMMTIVVFAIGSILFGKLPDGILVLYTLFALAEPFFIYSWVYFFSAICNKRGTIALILVVSLTVVGS